MTLINKNLERMKQLLLDAYPDGVSTSELSNVLDVSDQTVRNYIVQLSESGVPVRPEKSPYYIDPAEYKQKLEFEIQEAWQIYLPLRRLIRGQKNNTETSRVVLQKIGRAIRFDLGEHLDAQNQFEPVKNEVFEHLIEAWNRRKTVRIRYEPLEKSSSHLVIAPFWFEPAVWTDSIYCIAGIGDDFQQLITLKLDRVTSATLLEKSFSRPSVKEILENITNSWGIWTSNNPEKVVVRFSNRVIQRVLETHWHPTQETKMDTAGHLIWTALISEPQEMMPWIRSWGVDAELLEPIYLT
jgi:predicted DNA-binding transcriptional regulator YafY